MKAFFSVLVVLAMVSPLCADTVVLQEDFDGTGATAGSTIDGYNGWSGNSNMVFSDTVIDSGLSAGATTGANYPNVQKGFSYTPGSGEVYTLTGTLRITNISQYASVELVQGGLMPFYAGVGGGTGLEFGYYSDPDYNNLTSVSGAYTLGTVVDVKAVVTNGNADCYVRTHGASSWDLVGSVVDAGIAIANFNGVKVSNKAKDGYFGGLTDSIQLTCGPVPEPSSLVLTLGGLIGLLAYAWRKQK